jgi:DNA-binding transcriptional ArsR family regulator
MRDPSYPAVEPRQLTGSMVSSSLPFVKTYQRSPLGVLAEPTRLAIFELLAEQALPVGELAARLPVSRPAVSQHLKVLKEVGLVVDRPVGTRRLYQVDPSGVAELRTYLERFWNLALSSFKAVVENSGGTHDIASH